MPEVVGELEKETVVLIKPNYMPCIFEKDLLDGNC